MWNTGLDEAQDGIKIAGRNINNLRYAVQFSAVAQLCLTFCNPMNHSTPGLLVYHPSIRYADTLIAESEEELKTSWLKWERTVKKLA